MTDRELIELIERKRNELQKSNRLGKKVLVEPLSEARKMRIYTVEHIAWAYMTFVSDGTQTILQSALAASTYFNTAGPWIVKDEQGNQWEVNVQRTCEWKIVGPVREEEV